MSVHSHKSSNGRTVRVPHLFEVDFSGDKLVGQAAFRGKRGSSSQYISVFGSIIAPVTLIGANSAVLK